MTFVPQSLPFGSALVSFFPEGTAELLHQQAPPDTTILLTDTNIARLHAPLLQGYQQVIVPAGEDAKSLSTVAQVASQCLQLGADRTTLLLGVGGGMITDLTGFVASVLMRGLPVAFAPTTVLAMVDAAWGGKNGVNLDEVKNVLGTIRQPRFVAHLPQTLQTLSSTEWASGFAEIIKYGCIADTGILTDLEKKNLSFFRENAPQTAALMARCVGIKSRFVEADEHETGIRRYLNFGHTLGHAIERQCALSHGAAVGLGMLFALRLSAQLCGLSPDAESRLEHLLQRYDLPVRQPLDFDKTLALMQNDKKRIGSEVLFVLLEDLGKPRVSSISWTRLRHFLQTDPRWS